MSGKSNVVREGRQLIGYVILVITLTGKNLKMVTIIMQTLNAKFCFKL